MEKTFALVTLKTRLNETELQPLDLHLRIQRALRTLILDGVLSPGAKPRPSIAPSMTKGTLTPSQRNPAMKVVLL